MAIGPTLANSGIGSEVAFAVELSQNLMQASLEIGQIKGLNQNIPDMQ